ncbi:Aprataxin-like protein [Nakaseomyces bracarensis]|uniref:Aprataxin-like protein n=1 Tax=Nakaseomyces bracarensis TaxID=273131 RepID=A0ABR4NVI5_9SACH
MGWESALQQYIDHPDKYGKDTVIFSDSNAVIIHDGFPKSKYHLLVLPRSHQITKKHPTIALTPQVKDQLSDYVQKAIDYIYHRFSEQYRTSSRVDALYTDKASFTKEFIQVGIHSVPSMNNLHVHVLTRDFNSVRLKHKKHYNSFNTKFFVSWDDLPLQSIPVPKTIETKYIKNEPLVCSYCKKDFGSQFKRLKDHLEEEFEKHFDPIISID